MPHRRFPFGVVAIGLVVGSAGCTLQRAEECCPTDARRLVYSCAGEEAVRKGPCGPNEAYYGHHPTCWSAWPSGWRSYQAQLCAGAEAAACEGNCPVPTVAAEPAMIETRSPSPAAVPDIAPTPPPVEEVLPDGPSLLPSPKSGTVESPTVEPLTKTEEDVLPTYSELLSEARLGGLSKRVFGAPGEPASSSR